MDGLEFTSKLIEHGAWPAIATYVAVTQKKGIKALLARMSKFKAPGMEAEFDTKAETAAEKIEQRTDKPVEVPTLAPAVLDHVIRDNDGFDEGNVLRMLGGVVNGFGVGPLDKSLKDALQLRSPRLREEHLRASGLIIEEWSNLEQSIRLLAASKGCQDAKTAPSPKLLRRLVDIEVVSRSTAESIKELRSLRNQVAHTEIEPTREAAENFVASCWRVEQRLLEEEAAWQEAATKLASEMLAELDKPK